MRRSVETFRRPSRLGGLIVGVGYLVWLARHAGAGAAPGTQDAELLGALGLMILTGTAWVLGSGGAQSPSDAIRALLLPAPLRDRDHVALTLLAGQVVVLPNVALWTLLGSRGVPAVTLLQRAMALWVLFTIIMCHRALVSRVRGGVREGPRWLRRAGVVLGLALVACIPFVLTGSFDLAAGGLQQLAPRGAGAVLLLPFELPVRPLIASTTDAWSRALPGSALLLLAHVAVLLRLGPSREPAWTGQRTVGPALPAPVRGGADALAAWKAVTARMRRADLVRVLVASGVGAAALLAVKTWGSRTAAEFAGFLALTWSPIVLLLAPQFLRAGLRRDAGRVSLLRTLPAPGRSWVLGGAAAGGVLSAVLAGGLLLVGVAGAGTSEELGLPGGARPAALAAAMLLLVPVAMLAALIQDGLFLFFPGPLSLGTPQAGATRLGTTLVNSVLSVALLLLLLAPAVALAVSVWVLVPASPAIRIVMGAALAATMALGEIVALSRWLGARFEGAGAA
jgi:hypothetical protein